MIVELLFYTPYEVLMKAIRTSHDSVDKLDSTGNKLGKKDRALLGSIITKCHDSVLEHVVYTFSVRKITRALLVELARHRFVSLTVKSTRYTLRKDLENGKFTLKLPKKIPVADRERYERLVLDFLKRYKGLGNDVVKYLLPEAYLTDLVMTVNARELSHVITLRIQPGVLDEFRSLVYRLWKEVREVHPEMWSMLVKREGIENHLREVEAYET